MGDFPDIKELDFSEFHPLDHSVWACRDYPGGRRRHMTYRWEFQWRDRLRGRLLCPFGLHTWVTWYERTGGLMGVTCSGCEKEQQEG